MRLGIRPKLILAFLVPAVLLLAAGYFYAHLLARQALEEELGRRLVSIAQAVADRVSPEWVHAVAAGDEQSRGYRAQQRRLRALRKRIGLARVYLFDRNMTSRCDSQADVPIGTRYHQLLVDSPELARLFREAVPATSTLFAGNDGTLYKTGYAPIVREEEGRREVVAAVAVDGSAEFFLRLVTLRRYLLVYGALAAAAIIITGLLVARLVTRPVARLVEAAQVIGRGDLAHPIEVRSGDELGVLGRAMDEMRRELHQRNQYTQMMLAGIAHEVRNPLAGIELWSGLLREELEEDPRRRKHVDKIQRELRHLESVVNDFLDFAREKPPQIALMDVAELVREVTGVVGEKVTIEVDAPPALAIEADRNQIKRVLLNLLKNAAQACEDRGDEARVVVRVVGSHDRASLDNLPRFTSSTTLPVMTDLLLASRLRDAAAVSADEGGGAGGEKRPEVVRLIVEDNGCGIDPATLESIFTPFFTTKEKGTGLGLALAKKVVTAHGGRIDIASEMGKGTRVTVELPTWRPS